VCGRAYKRTDKLQSILVKPFQPEFIGTGLLEFFSRDKDAELM